MIMKKIIKKIGNKYINQVCKREFERQRFKRFNERAVEYAFVFKHLANLYPSNILDVGTGTTALPSLMNSAGFLVTAIDNIVDYWKKEMVNRHFYVINDNILSTKLTRQYELITCVSVLEHINNFDFAMKNMTNLLNTGGYIIITFPYNEYEYNPNVYNESDASYGKNQPYICQSFSSKELISWCETYNLEIIDQEYWQCFEGRLWTFGNQIIPPKKVLKNEPHQLSCILFRKQ